MGNGPSIFSKTPHEFRKEHRNLRFIPLRQRPVMYPPPRSFVLVQFLSRIEQLHEYPYLDFEGYFPLDEQGGLDLFQIKQTWGLETCIPIDSMRWKLFQLENDDYASPLAVHLLGQPRSRCIRVTETYVSVQTKVQRVIRGFIVDLVHAITYFYANTTQRTTIYLQYNTRLQYYYRAAQERRRKLISGYKQWYDDWERDFGLGSIFHSFLLLSAVLFYLFVYSGFVEFKLRAGVWEWFWMGSVRHRDLSSSDAYLS